MDTLTDVASYHISLTGTITGVSQYIKGDSEHGLPSLKPDLMTVAVEPKEQMLLTEAKGGEKEGPQGPHKIQGMCTKIEFEVTVAS